MWDWDTFWIVWATGWFIHTAIVSRSWWTGRLYWQGSFDCSCDECKPFRCKCFVCNDSRTNPKNNQSVSHATKGPHNVPHMLELPQVLGLAFGGLFVWWGFLICEAYDFAFKARESHLEYLKKCNRPTEEVLKELEGLIDEGSAETDKQVNEFVEKMQKKEKEKERNPSC